MMHLHDFAAQAVDEALKEEQFKRALILSLRLNEDSLVKKCIFSVSPVDIPAVAVSVPYKYIQRLVEAFADLLESSPHLEFILRWSQVLLPCPLAIALCTFQETHLLLHSKFLIGFSLQELCKAHGTAIQQKSRDLLPALKALQKAITRIHQDLADTCSSNEYMLRYLCSATSHK